MYKVYTVKEHQDGTLEFLNKNGKIHREDGPAMIYPHGGESWYHFGTIHREGGGPAVTNSGGDKFWYQNGKLHREDGPAIEYASGADVWALGGITMDESEFNRRTKVIQMTHAEVEALLGHKVEIIK